MATSYRKVRPLDPRDILVLDSARKPDPRPMPELSKLPRLDAPTALYPVETLVEALGKLRKIEPKNLQPGQSFTLSSARALVEGRGWLEVYNTCVVDPRSPTYQFVNNVGFGDESRQVNVWLSNLVPGRSYIVQLRVQAGQGGTFHIGTGEGDHLTRPAGDQTIPVLLFQVERDLSLVRIDNRGGAYYWAFVDATVTALEL